MKLTQAAPAPAQLKGRWNVGYDTTDKILIHHCPSERDQQIDMDNLTRFVWSKFFIVVDNILLALIVTDARARVCHS